MAAAKRLMTSLRYAGARETARWIARGEVPTGVLVSMGMSVGERFHRRDGVVLDFSHCWLIRIGDDVTMAPRVHVLAHDAATKQRSGYVRIGRVWIGNRVFIGAGAIILPDVSIGDDVIVAAGSVVDRNVSAGDVVGGNPARVIGSVASHTSKHLERRSERPVFDESWTLRGGITPAMKRQMLEALADGPGYVV